MLDQVECKESGKKKVNKTCFPLFVKLQDLLKINLIGHNFSKEPHKEI